MINRSSIRGKVLADVLVSKTPDGYLDVYLIVGSQIVELTHNSIQSAKLTGNESTCIPQAFEGRTIVDVRTDGETLFLVLDGPLCIEYGFSLGEAHGSKENIRFVVSNREIQPILTYLASNETEPVELEQ